LPDSVQRYRLCEACARRQDGGPGDFEISEDRDCFICRGLMKNANMLASKVARVARRYEFDSFAIGLSMPEGVQEREDELRSGLKIKGKETVKIQLSSVIGREVATALGKEIRKDRPDLTLVIDLASGGVKAFSRPLFFYGRYTKPEGVAQRREPCPVCGGKGCEKCSRTGFDASPSVEAALRKKFSTCGAHSMVFTWIGTEDRESEVLPPGRPFVVELKNPVSRKLPKRFAVNSRAGRVGVSRGRTLPSRPVKLPSFKFKTRITAKSKTRVDRERLRELGRQFRKATVQFNRPYDKVTFKRVSRVRARARGLILVIDAELDGGLPVKRFVSGELVSPSVSEVLKTEVRCQKFDIRRVTETSELEFG